MISFQFKNKTSTCSACRDMGSQVNSSGMRHSVFLVLMTFLVMKNKSSNGKEKCLPKLTKKKSQCIVSTQKNFPA